MKAIIIYISLLLLLAKGNLNAQCVPNNEFAQYCGTQINGSGDCNPPCYTFSDVCVPGWMRSHGTPEIMWINFGVPSYLYNPTNRPQWNVAYMWANQDQGARGEGIVSYYNFTKNFTYKVLVRYRVFLNSPNGGSDAEFRLIAAQDVHRPTSHWKRGNLVPYTDGGEQRIATITDKNTDWKQSATYTYVPNQNYNQFWIYPYTTYTNQYNLYVDWVYVCRDECDASYYYNQGVIPAGDPRSGYIYIGSSYGGSGTVTISSTANTTVVAGREITFKPEFNAVVTTGSFTAKIDLCNTPAVYTRTGDVEDSTISNLPVEENSTEGATDSYTDEYPDFGARLAQHHNQTDKPIENLRDKTQLLIYPNPAHDRITIMISSKKQGNIKLRLLNSLGVLVNQAFSSISQTGNKHIDMDISRLPAGSYLIQLTDAEGNVTVKKIQKLK
jgi:hypothetical protein